MTAYYNEIDPYAAAWLRNLIAAGHIAPGDVDERSIADVRPDELRGYTQCHFFAGIGVWSYALRRAGWPDDRPVWTGSCPCQPFSPAGRGEGFADERHLWPAWHHLIAECEPPVVFGEQVDGKPAAAWLDLVHSDLEAAGYAFGATVFPAAGVGAPHRRHRTYFVADAEGFRHSRRVTGSTSGTRQTTQGSGKLEGDRFSSAPLGGDANGVGVATGGRRKRFGDQPTHSKPLQAGAGRTGVLANAGRAGTGRNAGAVSRSQGEGQGEWVIARHQSDSNVDGGAAGELADAGRWGWNRRPATAGEWSGALAGAAVCGHGGLGHSSGPGPTNGFWRDPDWLFCRDGKWRPVEPGTSPLAHGAPARVGRLRAYGNAIVAAQAEAFIRAYADTGRRGLAVDAELAALLS